MSVYCCIGISVCTYKLSPNLKQKQKNFSDDFDNYGDDDDDRKEEGKWEGEK